MVEQRDRLREIVQEAVNQAPQAPKPKVAGKPAPPRPAEKFKEPPPLAEARGVGTFETNENIVLVNARPEAVTGALAKHRKARQMVSDAWGKKVKLTDPCFVVYRLSGHPWTIVDTLVEDENCLEREDAQALSRALKCKAIHYVNSDTASATRYAMFDRGKPVEVMEEVEGVIHEFKSASGRSEPDPNEVEAFVDGFLRDQDAYAPSWSSAMGGWRHDPSKSINLDFSAAFALSDVQRLDYVGM